MAAEVKKRNLVLEFGTTSGKAITLTINTPAEGLEGAQIKAAMDKIIAAKALGEEELATTVETAKYVVQQVEDISLT